MLYHFTLVLVHFLLVLQVTCDKRQFVELVQKLKRLRSERNKDMSKLIFATIKTKVTIPYNDIPTPSSAPKQEMLDQLRGKKPCKARLQVSVLKFRKKGKRTLCLFRVQDEPHLFDIFEKNNANINIIGKDTHLAELLKEVQPLKGFVVGDTSSVVSGHLVDGQFYGTIKVWDKRREYHLHFYIEPIENLGFYTSATHNDGDGGGDNAIVFEYVAHEDDLVMTTPTNEQNDTSTSTVGTITSTQEGEETTPIQEDTETTHIQEDTETTPIQDKLTTTSTEDEVTTTPTSKNTGTMPTQGDITTTLSQENSGTTPAQEVDDTEDIPKRKKREINPTQDNKDENTTPEEDENETTTQENSETTTTQKDVETTTTQDNTDVNNTTDTPDNNDIKTPQDVIRGDKSAMEMLLFEDMDLGGVVNFLEHMEKEGNGEMFDLRVYKLYTCSLCVWIQPNFAEKFGFNAGINYGIAELLDILRLVDWILNAQDFNENGMADNVGIKIKTVVVSDDFGLKPVVEGPSRRSKRAEMDPLLTAYYDNLQLEMVFERDFDYNDIDEVTMKPNLKEKDDQLPEKKVPKKDKKSPEFSQAVLSLPAEQVYQAITPLLQVDSRFQNCCSILGFIYHNLSPSLSVSSLGGACSDKGNNIALISGLLHTHKIGKFDILRSILHSLGHLFGAPHDSSGQYDCSRETDGDFSFNKAFINPFLMDPYPQINVGLRPNSLRFSQCSKISISIFLASSQALCLSQEDAGDKGYCGNGWTDYQILSPEMCDCGSPWECGADGCCGERDSLFQCQRLDSKDTALTAQTHTCRKSLQMWSLINE